MDMSNPSCLYNRSGFRFDGVGVANKSALTVLSDSWQAGRTYQLMVLIEHRYNSSLQATGYLLVRVDDTYPKMIIIG
jgi:hypothetical protein